MKINYQEAKKLIDEERAQFVDVRTPEEFKELGIAGSINMPLQVLPDDHDQHLDQDKTRPVILFCRSGVRSNDALNILKALGYTRLYDMGSYLEWQG